MTMHDFIFDQRMDGLIKRTCIKMIAIASRTTKRINCKNFKYYQVIQNTQKIDNIFAQAMIAKM